MDLSLFFCARRSNRIVTGNSASVCQFRFNKVPFSSLSKSTYRYSLKSQLKTLLIDSLRLFFQVKHLESCVSVNVDFASPESLPRMFHLVQAMRAMPASQELSEDKLQIKNIVFHAVKSALAVLKGPKRSNGVTAEDKKAVVKVKAEDDKNNVKKEGVA